MYLALILIIVILYKYFCKNKFMGKPWLRISYDPNLYPNPNDINLASEIISL